MRKQRVKEGGTNKNVLEEGLGKPWGKEGRTNRKVFGEGLGKHRVKKGGRASKPPAWIWELRRGSLGKPWGTKGGRLSNALGNDRGKVSDCLPSSNTIAE